MGTSYNTLDHINWLGKLVQKTYYITEPSIDLKTMVQQVQQGDDTYVSNVIQELFLILAKVNPYPSIGRSIFLKDRLEYYDTFLDSYNKLIQAYLPQKGAVSTLFVLVLGQQIITKNRLLDRQKITNGEISLLDELVEAPQYHSTRLRDYFLKMGAMSSNPDVKATVEHLMSGRQKTKGTTAFRHWHPSVLCSRWSRMIYMLYLHDITYAIPDGRFEDISKIIYTEHFKKHYTSYRKFIFVIKHMGREHFG